MVKSSEYSKKTLKRRAWEEMVNIIIIYRYKYRICYYESIGAPALRQQIK